MSETRDAVDLFELREELSGAAEDIASLRANVNESKDAVELFESMLQKSQEAAREERVWEERAKRRLVDTARKARAETERAVARTAEGVRREAIEAAKFLRAEILVQARAENRRSVRAFQVQ